MIRTNDASTRSESLDGLPGLGGTLELGDGPKA
jgi:hypothetical protein